MKLCFVIMLSYALSAGGQSLSDTTFYDLGWQKCTHDSYSYYRTVTKHKDLYTVTDHYRNGVVQMTGTYTSLDPEIKNGFCTYYYPSGNKKEEAEYYNGKRRGTFKFYGDSMGVLMSSIEYKDDMKNGRSVRYANGKKVVNLYRNDRLVAMDVEGKRTTDNPTNKSSSNVNHLGNDAGIYKEIVKRKFDYLPDSLKHISAMITVSFEVDSDHSIFNIKPDKYGNKVLTNLMVSALKEMPRWEGKPTNSDSSISMTNSFTVAFPSILVSTGSYMFVSGNGISTASQKAFSDSSFQNFFNSMPGTGSAAQNFFNSVSGTGGTSSWFSTTTTGQLETDTLRKFIKARYDQAYTAHDSAYVGLVMVQFDIKDGSGPENIEVLYGKNKEFSDFIIQAIREFNGFKPQVVAGKPVETVFKISMSFPLIMVTGNSSPKQK